ncbi:E3 ubiquitin-protein ligase PPP1R11-like [Anopheles ziemanni]|uniref:E3 ubiquitin-protein ligase PPP1R11-like n=1 Tax=Anopheles coustani TaxID=139045 RepID=UPI00265A21AC|nr:E3 ubiquitin-protein ligase PPP1R11-like [Anopheles coustani]XP_058168094.1 E3 ubiquitin-protein ligase PPP1R11-like [Anopheles ziemanni]
MMSAETPTLSRTITETIPQDEVVPGPSTSPRQEPPVLRLRLQKPRNDKKVQWTNGTVDNEHMNKKKSKCCCIYVKPRAFGESSSESEDECENCFGHVELKKKNQKKPSTAHGDGDEGENDNSDGVNGPMPTGDPTPQCCKSEN